MELWIVLLVIIAVVAISAARRPRDDNPLHISPEDSDEDLRRNLPKQLPVAPPAEELDSSSTVVLSSLLPRQFIVLDLETTGLDPLRDEIIEFGVVRVCLDVHTHPTFQTLVKPKRKIPKKITEITGITQEMVDGEGIDPSDALAQFIEFIGDLPIVTYNAEFDMGFIRNAARQQGITISNRYACALKRARRAWPDLPSHRLSYIADVEGLPNNDAHRALGDCERALNLFVRATIKLNQKVRWTKPLDESGTRSKHVMAK